MIRYIHSIIKDEAGRLLMQSLPDKSWQTLSGKVEKDEYPREALIRIASHDLGLMLNNIKLVDVIRDPGRHIHVFSASIGQNVMDEYVRHSRRFYLFSDEELKQLKLNENTEFILDRERKHLGTGSIKKNRENPF